MPDAKEDAREVLKAARIPAADKRVLEKFLLSQQYDALHYSTQALRSIEQGLRWWAALHEASSKLALSGLPAPPLEEVAGQQEILALIQAIAAQLQKDRARRLAQAVDTEQELEREWWKQIRAQQKKAAADAKAKASPTRASNLAAASKVAMEHQLAEREEPKVPGVNLDPKLLRQSVEALNLKEANQDTPPEKPRRKRKKPIPRPQ